MIEYNFSISRKKFRCLVITALYSVIYIPLYHIPLYISRYVRDPRAELVDCLFPDIFGDKMCRKYCIKIGEGLSYTVTFEWVHTPPCCNCARRIQLLYFLLTNVVTLLTLLFSDSTALQLCTANTLPLRNLEMFSFNEYWSKS